MGGLFRRANDSPYALERVAEEKCFGAGYLGAPVTRVVERNGAVAGAAVTCGKYLRILAVDRSLRRNGIGTQLLDDARARGARVVFAEPGNYLTPGIWMDDAGTRAFFKARGFVETATTWNLEVNPATQQPSNSATRATDAQQALNFIEREFGKIWRFEATPAFDADPPNCFITEDAGEITGFVVHNVNNRGLGFFGPTGVAKSMRGRGLGRQLLLASLAHMHRLGFARVIIPWTDALEFYRRSCGAEPAHQFVGAVDSRP